MIAAALFSVMAAGSCPVEQAYYQLRTNPAITMHFERAPRNGDWPSGLTVAIYGTATDRTTYWLPWNGGTDDQRHIRRTEIQDHGVPLEVQRRIERRGDHDFFTLDGNYDFLPAVPKLGDRAPAHLLIPNLNLWYSGEINGVRDSSPRGFFDLVRCGRDAKQDRSADIILPYVP